MPDTKQLLVARRFAALLAPECGAVLARCKAERTGRFEMPADVQEVTKRLGVSDFYVTTYENEASIYLCAHKYAIPTDITEAISLLDAEIESATENEISEALDQLALEFAKEVSGFDIRFPKTESERQAARAAFDALSEAEQKQATIRAQYFLIFFNAYFYNMLSLMVHGQKLTTLVPLAIQGDQEAFCKAVQIDRNLLLGHPYFKETYSRLIRGGDPAFLKLLTYRLNNATTRGKIRFPALYMVFATLDSFQCLDALTAGEVLDICDEAGLERFQNRIEDENNLVRRRIEYRAMQKRSK